jgi:hypothetical protein
MKNTNMSKEFFAGVFLKKSMVSTINTNTSIGTLIISSKGSSITMYAMSKSAKGESLVC